jgi:predicted NBD/HSP70 family sugar kinase
MTTAENDHDTGRGMQQSAGARWSGGSVATRTPVARASRMRVENLAAVLRRVHHSGSISRSQLTRTTGLNRSTIATLVSELVQRRLVVEADPKAAGEVGRPSPVVAPDPRTVAAVVYPELDAVTVGLVQLGGTVLLHRRQTFGSPPTPGLAVATAAAIIRSMSDGLGPDHRLVGVGIAVPGMVESAAGIVRIAPHLGWYDEPIAEMLSRATGLDVHAANDASLGANAERIFGAGRGIDDLVYLNGGVSGIGGGIIAGGMPLRGHGGFAGEIGHTLVTTSDERDPSGARGSLELTVNRRALVHRLGLDSPGADRLEAALIGSDDPLVLAEVRRQLDHLAIAIGNVADILNPELVVLGGFLASLDAASPGTLERLVADRAPAASVSGLRIVRAELGSSLLMIGAAELAFGDLLADPTIIRP